jgi:hypothetical protein
MPVAATYRLGLVLQRAETIGTSLSGSVGLLFSLAGLAYQKNALASKYLLPRTDLCILSAAPEPVTAQEMRE